MAKNTAQVKFNVINNAYSIDGGVSGVAFVIGETLRGPDFNPEDIITSVSQFEKYFGPVNDVSDFAALCIQAIQSGAALRICRVVADDADSSASGAFSNGTPEDLFSFTSKERGAYTNNLKATVSDASNGDATMFNLKIEDTVTGEVENYANLLIPDGSTSPTYLKRVTDFSRLVKVVYENVATLTGDLRPINGTEVFTGGLDGAAPTITDFIGSQAARTGFYAFDGYDDAFIIAALGYNETNLSGIGPTGAAYVNLRKDLIFLHHLDNAHNTTTTMVAEKNAVASSSKLVGIIGGGKKAIDPINGGIREYSALGELLGVIVSSHNRNGVWASPTNRTRGRMDASIGVVNNFGSPATLADLNILANQGINMVVNKNGINMLWDFYSQDPLESPEKFLTVVLTQIYLKRALVPAMEGYLTDGNTPDTWREVYYGVKPFLDNLVGPVFQSYSWNGDQFAKNLDSLSVNDKVEVGQGKYRVKFKAVMTVPMVEFTIDFIMETDSSN